MQRFSRPVFLLFTLFTTAVLFSAPALTFDLPVASVTASPLDGSDNLNASGMDNEPDGENGLVYHLPRSPQQAIQNTLPGFIHPTNIVLYGYIPRGPPSTDL